MNKILYNKTAKGIVSLLAVIVLMSSILAATLYNQSGITGNAIAEDNSLNNKINIYKKQVNDVSQLNQLNEGWYKIVSGNVLYLESFDSTIPLFIKIKNPLQQNGLLVVDYDGNLKFEADSWDLASADRVDVRTGNLITGEVTGLESISGMEVTSSTININGNTYMIEKSGGWVTIEHQNKKYAWDGKDFYVYTPEASNSWSKTTLTGGLSDLGNALKQGRTELFSTSGTAGTTSGTSITNSGPTGGDKSYKPSTAELQTINSLAEQAERDKGLPSGSMKALASVESSFNPKNWPDENNDGVPDTTAKGLYQITDATAKQMAEKLGLINYDIWDPATNTKLAAEYLAEQYQKYNGNLELAYAAYYIGPEKVSSSVPVDARNHVNKVATAYLTYSSGQTLTSLSTTDQIRFLQNRLALLQQGLPTDIDQKTDEFTQLRLLREAVTAAESFNKNPIEQNQRSYLQKLEALNKFEIQSEFKGYASSYLLTYINNPDSENREVAKAILNERIAKSDLNTLTQLSTMGAEGKDLLFEAANTNTKIKDYIKQQNLETEYQLYQQRKAQCATCVYDAGTKLYKNEQGQAYELRLAADGSSRFVLVGGAGATPSAAATAKQKENTRNAINQIQNIGIYYVMEGDGYFILQDKSTGKFFSVVSDQQGKLAIGSEITSPPKRIVDGNKQYQLFEQYQTSTGASIYKDSTGKLYDQKGNPLTGGEISQSVKYGDVDAKLFFNVKDGRIVSDNVIRAEFGDNVKLDGKTFKQVEGFIKTAGKNPTFVFDDSGRFVISNEQGIYARASTANAQGVSNARIIESDFVGDIPRKTKITSPDERTSITEEKEVIQRDTGRVDSNGNPIIETETRVKNWFKIEQQVVKDSKGNDIVRTLRATRKYEVDKETGKQTGNYEETTRDSLTGEPISSKLRIGTNDYLIEYTKDGPVVKVQSVVLNSLIEIDIKSLSQEVKEKIEERLNDHKKWSSRKFIADFEQAFTEFRGLGYYATLFFEDDYLLKWRNNVDKAFATAYLGTEYWTSEICDGNIEAENDGIAYAETPQGLAQVGAHIEATRTPPIKDEKGTIQFIYKITFSVRNGDYDKDMRAPENMSINVVIVGGDPSTQTGSVLQKKVVKLFKKDQNIKRGAVFSKAGSNAIVKNSSIIYGEICLTFDKIPEKWKVDRKQDDKYAVCNIIKESVITPTTVRQSTSSQSGSNQELNDI